MGRELLLWPGIFFQGAGLAVLARAGAFFPGRANAKPRPGALRVCGLSLFFAGVACMAVFAVMERHFLLVAAEVVAAVLVCLGLARSGNGGGDRS